MLLNHGVATTQPQVCTQYKTYYGPLCKVFNLDYILFYRNEVKTKSRYFRFRRQISRGRNLKHLGTTLLFTPIYVSLGRSDFPNNSKDIQSIREYVPAESLFKYARKNNRKINPVNFMNQLFTEYSRLCQKKYIGKITPSIL